MNTATGRIRDRCRRMSFVINCYEQPIHDSVRGALLKSLNTTIVAWVQHPTSPNNLVVPRENQVRYSVLTSACQLSSTKNVWGTQIHRVSTYSPAKNTLLYTCMHTILRRFSGLRSSCSLRPRQICTYPHPPGGTTNTHPSLFLQQ